MKKILAAFALICSLVVINPPQSEASPLDSTILESAVNAQRVARGLPELELNAELESLATAWAGNMASQGSIFHSDLATGVTQNWKRLGENVGSGANALNIAGAFAASPTHLANIVDPAFEYMGIGVVVSSGTLYVVQKFMQLNPEIVSKPIPTPPPTTIVVPALPPVVVTTTSSPPTTTTKPIEPVLPSTTTRPEVGKIVGEVQPRGSFAAFIKKLISRLKVLFNR